MESTQLNAKQYFTALSIVHISLLAGQVIFGLVTFGVNSEGQFGQNPDLNEVFKYVAPLFLLSGIGMSYYISKMRLNGIKQKSEIAEKLSDYRSVIVVKWALLEVPSLFCIICYMLTANIFYLGLTGLVIIVFVMNKPSKNKLIEELELDMQEIEILESDEIVT